MKNRRKMNRKEKIAPQGAEAIAVIDFTADNRCLNMDRRLNDLADIQDLQLAAGGAVFPGNSFRRFVVQ